MRTAPTAESIRKMLADDPHVGRLLEVFDGRLAGVHLVGGSVRDLLLGLAPSELDLVVEGDAVHLARELTSIAGGNLKWHDRFGTATFDLDGFPIDIASARTESYPVPGALPEVELGHVLDEDLLRRDFTVNAIAMALDGSELGSLSCVDGAFEDLEAGILRVLHPGSFIDDPTRIWRLCRYAGRLGFGIDPRTLELAHEAIACGALASVSVDRHTTELLRCVADAEPDAVIEALGRVGVLEAVGLSIPGADLLAEARSIGRGHCTAAEVRVAALFDLEPSTGIPDSFRLPPSGARIAESAARIPELRGFLSSNPSRREAARRLRGVPDAVVAVSGAAAGGDSARLWLDELRDVTSPVTAAQLIDAGVPKGPALGRALEAARDAVIDEPSIPTERALQVALDAAERPGIDA